MIGASGAALRLPLWRAERILYDRDGLFVVDKPAHIPVHGGDETLRHGLVARVQSYLESVGRSTYLGVHSRLDQETTGVLLFTTDESRNRDVHAAMEERRLRRSYTAVVRCRPGHRLADSGKIELRLGDEVKGLVPVVPRGGKLAVTHYRVRRRVGDRALVELSLETGRTHQIRVSLSHWGAPIVGDTLYGGDPHARLHLHAGELSGELLVEPVISEQPSFFEATLEGREERPKSLDELVRDAALLRAPLLDKTSAFRLINGEGDGLPGLTIDVYGTAAVVNVYEESYRERFEELRGALLSIGVETGYVKTRVRADLRKQDSAELAPLGPWFGPPLSDGHTIVENGMVVGIELSDGLSTGLFLDQRDHRERARGWAGGGRVLNLFSYTGSFSVATALSGCKTVSVDLSGRALERARANFALNHLPLEGHSFIKDDAMKYLARAVNREARYNLIVLDPPSFATVGKGTFSVSARYEEAATLCLSLLVPGGRLLAVTNHEKTTPESFRRMLKNAAERAKVDVKVQTLGSQLDCPPSARGPFPSKSLLVTRK